MSMKDPPRKLKELCGDIRNHLTLSEEFRDSVKDHVERMEVLERENTALKNHLYLLVYHLGAKGVELPQQTQWWYEEECFRRKNNG